jgi:ATP/ADP translocase
MSEYALPLSVCVLFIGLVICVINSVYAKMASKNPSTWRKQNAFTTYQAWIIYAVCITVMIIALFIISTSDLLIGITNMGKAQQSVSQIQQQMTTSDDSSDTTQ